MVDAEYVINSLKFVSDECLKEERWNPQAVNKANELLGKHLGLYVERKQLEGNLNISPLIINIKKPDKQ